VPAKGLQNVVVTGGGSGIGAAIARAVLGQGGRVVVVGRRDAVLQDFVSNNPGAQALRADLTDADDRATVLARAKELLGTVDGVVHSAGVVTRERFGQISEQALREQLEIHVVAALRLCEQALSTVEPGGAILLVSSTLGHRPASFTAVYSMAKAAQHTLVRALVPSLAKRGIRINSLSPGAVDTAMMEGQDHEALIKLHPLGRMATPEEIASAALYLLGSAWVTGTDLVVDGGLISRD
jgi:NAD(P)-dependent dehydrogenase (short-subunit alcohol dehydrogenase family)